MPYTTAARNAMVTALAVTHLSLHTADPGDTGANSVSGSGYARQPVTFGTASAGVRNATGTAPIATFSGPANATVTHVGFWTAATGGTFLGSDPLNAGADDLAFNAAGSLQVSTASLSLTLT